MTTIIRTITVISSRTITAIIAAITPTTHAICLGICIPQAQRFTENTPTYSINEMMLIILISLHRFILDILSQTTQTCL